MPVGTYNPELGSGVEKLMEAFMMAGSTKKNADMQAGKNFASEAESIAKAREAGLKADQMKYAQGRTWKDIATGLGVNDQAINDFEEGKQIDPVTTAKILRAKITNEFIQRGGGSAEQQAKALQTNQETGLADAVLSKSIPATAVSEAMMASGAKPLFHQESGQILNQATGETQQTPLSKAHIAKLVTEGGGAPGTVEASYDQVMGKGSWKKLTPQSQTMVYQGAKAGKPMDTIINDLKSELDEPKANITKSDEEIMAARNFIADNPPKIPSPKDPNVMVDNPSILNDIHYYDVLRKATQKLRGRADPQYELWLRKRDAAKVQPSVESTSQVGGGGSDPLGLR